MSLLAKSGSIAARLLHSNCGNGNVDKAVVGINNIALLTAEPGDYND